MSFKGRQNQQQQQQHEGSRVNNSAASLEWIFYFLFFGGFVGYPRSPLMFENSPRFWSGYHRTNSLGWWWFCTVLRGMATLPRKLLRLPAPLLRSLYTLISNSPPPVGSSTANSNCNKNANTHNNKNTHTYTWPLLKQLPRSSRIQFSCKREQISQDQEEPNSSSIDNLHDPRRNSQGS